MKDFQIQILERLHLNECSCGYGKIYQNDSHPEYGSIYIQEREPFYTLLIGNYTISKEFRLAYESDSVLMHFGIFEKGKTFYQSVNKQPEITQPSSFFTVEDHLSGIQEWKSGTHFQGIELLISDEFLAQIGQTFPEQAALLDYFHRNETYHFLPFKVELALKELEKHVENHCLSPLLLESKILEVLSFLAMEVQEEPNGFASGSYVNSVRIGQNRTLHISNHDIQAAAIAYEIIHSNVLNPPSIDQLAEMVGISVQRLRTVFQYQYHTSIGAYITSARMSEAARLLATTNLPVIEIAHSVGYQQSGNFSRMFQKTYGRNPAEFRKDARV